MKLYVVSLRWAKALVFSVGIASAAQGFAAETKAARPNILLILADDLGFSDIGCFGAEIATPNLDQLASGGVRFTQFYNSARCCPTRASLLTGLYPHQAGVGNMAGGGRGTPGYEGHLTDRCMTMAEALKPAGYRCFMVGKWHLGKTPNPVERGFDEFYGMLGGFNTCWKEHPSYSRLPEGHPRREYARDKFHSAEVFGDYALDFIADARKNPTKPWFLYLAFNAAHFPLHAPESEIAKYEKVYAQGWDKIREQRFARQKQLGIVPKDTEFTPRSNVPANWANQKSGWADKDNPAWDSLPADRRADLARRMAVYAAMIDRMDQNIGRVLSDLREHGELDNTLIVFLSDNGACAEWDPFGFDGSSGPNNVLHTGDDLKKIGAPESYVSYGSGWANACNTPWRLYKHYAYEGGISAPCIIRLPGTSHSAAMNATPSHIIDLMPTFLEAAGVDYPKAFAGNPVLPLEGRSLMPLLKGTSLAERPLYFEHEGNRGVRDGKWKLVSLGSNPWELYDFTNDRSELHNLAEKNPDVVSRLAKDWDTWAARSMVRRPTPTSAVVTPVIVNKALTISCEVTPTSGGGVILAQGGREDGYALWLADKKLFFTVRVDGKPTSVTAPAPSRHFNVTAKLNRDATMDLAVDGKTTATGKARGLIPVQPKDELSIGEDDRSAVGEYSSPNPFRGKVENVRVVAN